MKRIKWAAIVLGVTLFFLPDNTAYAQQADVEQDSQKVTTGSGSIEILRVEAGVIDTPVPVQARDNVHLVYDEIRIMNYDRTSVRLEKLEAFSDVRGEWVWEVIGKCDGHLSAAEKSDMY